MKVLRLLPRRDISVQGLGQYTAMEMMMIPCYQVLTAGSSKA